APLLALAELADDGLERVDDLVAIDAALREADLQIELLGRGPIGEYVLLWPSRLRLRRRLPQLLARGAPLAGDLFNQGGHFLGRLLPNYLQEQRLRGNVGQPTKVPHLVRNGVQRERLRHRRP